MKKRGRIITLVIIVVLLLVTATLSVLKASGRRDYVTMESGSGITGSPSDTDMIKVYVTGEVVSPGIVDLARGATIIEAVEACGGFTENASGNINLVYSIDKNVTMVIKSMDDGGGAAVREEAGDAVIIDDENGIIDGKININSADVSSLVLLPGIGEKTAMDIIKYRQDNGGFLKTDDVMLVPGIKESKFSKIRDYICID